MANEDNEKFGTGRAILVGVLLILLLTPALQWIGRGATGSSAELDVPAPMAVGVLTVCLVMAGILGLLRASRRIQPRTCVILYVMLTTSIPFCNFGLVHGFFASVTSVAAEYLDRRVTSIRMGYEAQNPKFYPKITEASYAEFRRLGEEAKLRPQDSADLQEQQMQLLAPMKRFWSGVVLDTATKARLDAEGASVWTRAREAFWAIPWSIWRPVLIAWGGLIFAVLAGMLLLGRGIASDWIERENLPFPAAQLPLGLIAGGEPEREGGPPVSLFRNGYFLSGASLSILLLLIGGLAHYHILNLPLVGPVTFQRIDFQAILVAPPWNVLAENILFLSPALVGLALLVHQDILKGSLTVFGILMALRFAAGLAETGIRESLGSAWQGNALPYFRELGTGAVVVWALIVFWRNRTAIFGGRGHMKRLLAWLLVSGVVAGWWYAHGLVGWHGLIFLGFFAIWTILGGVALARARAEGGLAQGSIRLSASDVAFNTGSVSTHGLNNVLAFNHSFFLTISALPGLLASTIEGLYLGRKLRVPQRSLLLSIAVAFVTALVVGSVSFLVISYAVGAQNFQLFTQRMARFPFYDTFMAGDVAFQSGADILRVAMIPVGALVLGLLVFARRRFPRSPIPPISFLVICLGTLTYHRAGEALQELHRIPINVVWGPILIAFLLKGMVLRYGGMDLYVRSRPAALGLVFGHAMMIVAWNIYHAVFAPGTTLFTGVFQ